MKIGTLRKFLCTFSVAAALLLGMSITTEAQRRSSSYGRWRERNYGQQVSARMHRRNRSRHRLNRHQWEERRRLNARFRLHRQRYGNNRDWRLRHRQQRTALRRHQREERGEFKERWKNKRKNNRKWRD